MTKSDMESLDAFHRKQLKQVWKITWKQKVTNEKLYRISKTKPLSKEIAKARWKLFGHVLRLHNETPAQRSVKYYFENNENRKKFRGRPRATIVTTLDRDISDVYDLNKEIINIKKLKNYNDIEQLQGIA